MKILQISDLHLGRRLKDFSLLDDQKAILDQALLLMKSPVYDALFLCGDIFDTTVPTAGATVLFDEFLAGLCQTKKPVFIISGNHDSAEKLHFGSAIFALENIHIVTHVEDSLTPVRLSEDIQVYLLPFIRPLDVNEAFATEFRTYTEAIGYVLSKMAIDTTKTNLLLAHQTVLPMEGELTLGGSEDIASLDGVSVGSVDSVPAALFKDFDYVALGHIHKPQTIAKNARYAGSIYKYHRNEADNPKSFTVIDVQKKTIIISTVPIVPIHDVIKIEGTMEEILKSNRDTNAYVFASLTDKALIEDPMAKLRTKYPLTAWIDYVDRESVLPTLATTVKVDSVSRKKLFADFFKTQNGQEMSDYQKQIVEENLPEKESER
jgi:exonuclease SbcD